MAISVVPTVSGGGIKLVQRGSVGGSGNVTITAVDITKSFVNVFGTASSGTVSMSGSIPETSISSNSRTGTNNGRNHYIANATLTFPATSLTGGTNNLVAAVVQGFLANSTTLTVSGACRWEVVEFN